MKPVPDSVLDVEAWGVLQELDTFGVGLTTWECEFVDSLLQALRAGKTLTSKQKEKLASICEARL